MYAVLVLKCLLLLLHGHARPARPMLRQHPPLAAALDALFLWFFAAALASTNSNPGGQHREGRRGGSNHSNAKQIGARMALSTRT